MTRLLLYSLATILFGCANTSQDSLQTYVFDYENILSDEQENDLNKLYSLHEKETSNQIVLVTTPDYGDEPNMLLYSVKFGKKHGVGQKGKDNGVVIVFSQTLKETRISTGYGTERVLTDKITKEIIDSIMIPKFKKGELFDGIYEGSKAVTSFLEKPENEIK